MPGTNISAAEVTHVSVHGFWLLLGDEELLLPFPEFPWFRQATIEQLTTRVRHFSRAKRINRASIAIKTRSWRAAEIFL